MHAVCKKTFGMFRSVDAYPLSCHSHSVRDSCFDCVIMDLLHIVVLPSMQCCITQYAVFAAFFPFISFCANFCDGMFSPLLILIRLCWMKCSLSCTYADEMLDVQIQHFTGTFKLLHVHRNGGQYHDLKILWLLRCMQIAQNSDC